MNREIKFRAWHKAEQVMGEVTTLTDKGAFVVGVKPAPDQFIAGRRLIVFSPTDGRFCKLDEIELMQFTGLRDKNGVEIYEGDIVRYKRPYRSTQTHTGNNIPNGSYTEPMEPEIKTIDAEVHFEDGIFGLRSDQFYFPMQSLSPLSWEIPTYGEAELKESVSWRGDSDLFDWSNGDDGDLDYLLSEYGYASLDDLLMDISGIRVIGNIHQNPELL